MKKSSKKMKRGDGEVILYGETKAGETSQVTESPSLDNVGIAKADKGLTNDDFDFVGHPLFLVPTSSTVSKSDELKATEITTKVVKEVKKMSLNDVMKIKIEAARRGLRSNVKKADENRDPTMNPTDMIDETW